MKVDKKANFCIFFIIAILALGLSNFAAAFTGDFVSSSFPGINDTDKMIALDDDNFAPESVNVVYEPKKIVEEVNKTDNSTDNSTDDVEDDVDDGTDEKPRDNSDNQNDNSDSNNNENSGDDSDSKPKPSPSEDSSDDE